MGAEDYGTGLRVDLSLVWVMRYAKKVKADPSKSLVKDVDSSSLRIPVDPGLKFDLPKKVSVIFPDHLHPCNDLRYPESELVIYGNGSHLHDWRYCVCCNQPGESG